VRIAIGLEYDGTAYNGWQRQKTGLGVQARVEEALEAVANHKVEVVCAGRTDTGVHASGQVAHFDTDSEREPRNWLLGANSNLPDDINLTWAHAVEEDFHARYTAVSRSYRYLILNRLQRSALYRRRAWWVYTELDAERMHRAAQAFVGEHDFSAFRAAGCQAKTPVRTITSIGVARDSDWLEVKVTANAFLMHMVRNITGTLVAVGCGDETEEWAREVLESCDRTRAGVAAPPHGLTLTDVAYPAEFELPPNPNLDLR
jgi:tRNA pseudouridine38-40 synthase